MQAIARFSDGGPHAIRTINGTRARRRIAKVLAYIDLNYSRPLGLKHLASVAGVHSSHLRREFKKQVGASPREYVLTKRIEHATRLLKETEKSVKEIAFAVGFTRANSFSKIFKRVVGCSPRHYRSANHNRRS